MTSWRSVANTECRGKREVIRDREGLSLMVGDFVSAARGWLALPDGK